MAESLHNNMEATPSYIVYRDIPAGEPFDPTSPLLFFPPKGSDELFDALRVAFPHLKTHSERMRDAIIKYLLEERQDDQLQASPVPAMDASATTWPSVSSSGSASVLSSPETLNMSTPAYSPSSYAPQLTRQASVATSAQPSPPSLDQMTNVFSLSTSAQPKQRVRRKMTEAEKVEYRKRRIVKACDKCAKRKRKCPHNQTQMETVATSAKAASRSSKSGSPNSAKSTTPPASTKQVAKGNFVPLDELGTFEADMDMNSFQSFDDFTMFDDSFPELNMNEVFDFDTQINAGPSYDFYTPDVSPSQHSWPSTGNLQDFSFVDPGLSESLEQFDAANLGLVSQTQAHSNLSDQTPLFQQFPLESDMHQQFSMNSRVSSVPGVTAESDRHIQNGSRVSSSPGLAASADGSRVSRSTVTTGQQGGRVSRSVVNASQQGEIQRTGKLPNGPQRVPGGGETSVPGNGILWEHLRTGQEETPQPTHTAHVHGAGCGELFSLAEQNGVLKEPFRKPALQDATLRLVTTTRAVNAFMGLIKSEGKARSTRRWVSMERVLASRTDGFLKDSVHSGLPVHHTRPLQEAYGLYDVHKRRSNFQRESDLHEGVLAGVSRQELGQQTSTSVSHVSSGDSAALPQGRPQTFVSRRRNVNLSSSSSQGRRPERSLGEGINNLNGPTSSELFMLRRRLPRGDSHDVFCVNQETRRTWSIGHNDSISLSAQANGGAYPRLATNNPSSDFAKKDSEIRRAQGSSGGNRNEHPDRHRLAEASAKSSITNSSRGTIVLSDSQTIDRNLAAKGGNFVYADRLMDHVRYKDHHGRQDEYTNSMPDVRWLNSKDHYGRAVIQAGLGFALLAILTSGRVNAMILIMALLGPIAYVRHCGAEKAVQCTEANSAWLSSWHVLAGDALKRKNKDWLKGLMYPFTLAPMSVAAVC